MGSPALAPLRWALAVGLLCVQSVFLVYFLWCAYQIRMYPIQDFGYTIHELDPWFNMRATEYLHENGYDKFFKWYDYKSWYPLGRPIGTTIYPGMQMTGVAIHQTQRKVGPFTYEPSEAVFAMATHILDRLNAMGMRWLPKKLPAKIDFVPQDLTAICCMIPPWMGSTASLFCGLLAYEITRSVNAGVACVGIMSIIPAHLMRSIGGKFDNEAVAMTAICSTFWLWVRSVRTPRSWPYGLLAGVSYIYMVAAWGGYIFVINMIGVHALMLVGLGRYTSGLHKAYTLFFLVGTTGAIQIPVVGTTPLRSLEQIGPMGVFFGLQVLAFCDLQRRRRKMSPDEFTQFRIQAFIAFGAVCFAISCVLWPMGYFGPISSRIRGLFMRHTKTGNPLVDSVAEHQPANSRIYASHLNLPLDYWFHGALVLLFNRTNGAYFAALYGFIAAHFSGKMSRLVLICAPIVSVVCAVWVGFVLDFILEPFLLLLGKEPSSMPYEKGDGDRSAGAATEPAQETQGSGGKKGKESKEGKEGKPGKAKARGETPTPSKASRKRVPSSVSGKLPPLEEWQEEHRPGGVSQTKLFLKAQLTEIVPDEQWETYKEWRSFLDRDPKGIMGRAGLSIILILYILVGPPSYYIAAFTEHCDSIGRQLSNAQVKYFARTATGQTVLVDDYWKGYKWVAKNTPEDARVMAWWDYGYQITGIGKRTSIADGNTWNHEHIATLGKILTSPQKQAHNAIRHLADYVLVWAGGRSDDLAKSPHLARIGNSVFTSHCGDDDPKCTKFGFHSGDRMQPTDMMRKSLLYNLVLHGEGNARVNEKLFKEVHTTQRGHLRVFKVLNVSQESKDWVADPANRICDAPGSWYCIGQYPPALKPLIEMRRSFSQLEDFNKKGEKSAYSKLIEKERR